MNGTTCTVNWFWCMRGMKHGESGFMNACTEASG